MDMASSNGTSVNDRKVTTIDLKDGDVIKGGKTIIAVALGEGDPRGGVDLSPAEHTAPHPHLSAAPPLDPPPPGRKTYRFLDKVPSIPHYRIESELGQGGMGVVYLAHREGDGPPVALKTITPAVAHSAGTVGRFLREASVLRQLNHPNIVEFREIGQAGDRLYFVMDYVPGTDAEGLVKGHRGPLPVGRAVGLACQVLDGLAYAHARGFVHRDIKPKNILVETSAGLDRVKLADEVRP